MGKDTEKLIDEIAVRNGTTAGIFIGETELMLNEMSFPTDLFKTKPTVNQYFAKIAPKLRKELDAEKRVKSAKLRGLYSSKGMSQEQIAMHLLIESQRMIDEMGAGDFVLHKLVKETVAPRTPANIIAKIGEYVRWVDYVDLYKFVANIRGISVQQLEMEMDFAITQVWDDKKGQYRNVPEHRAFTEVLAAYEALDKGAKIDSETKAVDIPVNYGDLENAIGETPPQINPFMIASNNSTYCEVTQIINAQLGSVRKSIVQDCEEAFDEIPDDDFTKQKALRAVKLVSNKTIDEVETESARSARVMHKKTRA